MIQAFTNKLSDIIFHPKMFFDDMEMTGGFKEPLMFSFFVFLPVTFLGIILYFLGLPQMIVFSETNETIGTNQLSFFVFIRIIVWGCSLFFMSLLYHMGFKIVGGVGNFEATYKVVAYTSAAYLFNVVPRIGIVAYCFYSLFLIIIGGRVVHKITAGKAFVGTMIPVFIVMVILILVQAFN